MFSITDKKRPDRLVFRINNVDLSIVNSLRRIGLTAIPNVSLDFDMEHPDYTGSLKIHKNTSSLHNEFLMHRISLIPFCFSDEEIDKFDSNKYLFRLKVANTVTGSELKEVTTAHIEIFDDKGTKYPAEFHTRIFPPNKITGDHVLITKLRADQELDLEFKLTKATAEKHARWCPVSQYTFSYVSVSDLTRSGANKTSILDIQRNFVRDKWGEPSLFEFKIESECAMSPASIFTKSVDILKERILAIPEKIDVDIQNKLYFVNISGEDSTVVNVLQALIYKNCIREPKESKLLDFIGYYQPHPLVKHMMIKLKPAGDHETKFDAAAFITEQCERIASELDIIKEEWTKVA